MVALEAAVHIASAPGDRTIWMLVPDLLSFVYIVSSQEMMPPVGSWSAPPPLLIKITSTDIPRDHPRVIQVDISSWQLRYIASFLYLHVLLSALKICVKKYCIVLSMYTASMLSMVRNQEMLLYMREELVHTNSHSLGLCKDLTSYRVLNLQESTLFHSVPVVTHFPLAMQEGLWELHGFLTF